MGSVGGRQSGLSLTSSESSSSAKASSIASSIISSFIPIVSFCFSNSIMIFWICGRFIFLFILPIIFVMPFIDCACGTRAHSC